jgi:hypothetical protein
MEMRIKYILQPIRDGYGYGTLVGWGGILVLGVIVLRCDYDIIPILLVNLSVPFISLRMNNNHFFEIVDYYLVYRIYNINKIRFAISD